MAELESQLTFSAQDIVDNRTKKLRELMARHRLTAADVGEILDRDPHTVRVWRVKKTTRPIPQAMLELLTFKLQQQGAAR
jgi:hypothetical protein